MEACIKLARMGSLPTARRVSSRIWSQMGSSPCLVASPRCSVALIISLPEERRVSSVQSNAGRLYTLGFLFIARLGPRCAASSIDYGANGFCSTRAHVHAQGILFQTASSESLVRMVPMSLLSRVARRLDKTLWHKYASLFATQSDLQGS